MESVRLFGQGQAAKGQHRSGLLTGVMFDDESICRFVDVRVESRVRLPLEPGHLLGDYLVAPAKGYRELTDKAHGTR